MPRRRRSRAFPILWPPLRRASTSETETMTRRIKFETKDAPGELTLEDVQKAIDKFTTANAATVTELKAANSKLTDDLAETKANLFEVEQKMAAVGAGFNPMINSGSDIANELV